MNTIQADNRRRGPKLPGDVLPEGEAWHPRTLDWWDTWRKSAQAQTFLATDWDFLLDTALMHHTMWSKSRLDLASEVRLRAAKFGATPEDRARLKMEIENPDKATKPKTAIPADGSVIDIAARRKRLANLQPPS